MAISPDHLFEQAQRLIESPPAGRPRQVDIRRAISSAYYGIYHAVAAAAADQFVGAIHRTTGRYGLVYRSVNHNWLHTLCTEVQKHKLSAKFAPHAPPRGFGRDITAFAAATLDLQQQRHSADYDPLVRFNASNAVAAIAAARAAVRQFSNASDTERAAFLSLLLFPPRR